MTNLSPGRKAHLLQTEPPTRLPASYCFPSQLQGAFRRVLHLNAPGLLSVRDATRPAMSDHRITPSCFRPQLRNSSKQVFGSVFQLQ